MTDIARALNDAEEDCELFIEDVEFLSDKIASLRNEDPLMVSILYNQYVDEWHGSGWGLIDEEDVKKFSRFVKNYDDADYDLTQFMVFNYLDYLGEIAPEFGSLKEKE